MPNDLTTWKLKLASRFLGWLTGRPWILTEKDGKIIVDVPLEIHFRESLRISSDKHIILTSGQSPEPERPGYNYGVWFNPELDNNRRPLQTLTLVNHRGDTWEWFIQFDQNGKVIIPPGWTPL